MCDASAAVAVSSNLFLAANDEDNVLRLYRLGQGGAPVQRFDLTRFLQVDKRSPEVDLEGAATVGSRVFWIGSHGRNRRGKPAPSRARFFATDIRVQDGKVSVVPVGRPSSSLLSGLFADARYHRFKLKEASTLAPKSEDALNIEGLAATPEGHLLVGFRNPIPDDKALLAPLLNPNEVVLNSALPRFGQPLQLDLGGLGIRDIGLHNGEYLILAGPHGGGNRFALYRWAGGESRPVVFSTQKFSGFNPEALVFFPGRPAPFILSDDGTRLNQGVPCKELKQESLRSFRALFIEESQGSSR